MGVSASYTAYAQSDKYCAKDACLVRSAHSSTEFCGSCLHFAALACNTVALKHMLLLFLDKVRIFLE